MGAFDWATDAWDGVKDFFNDIGDGFGNFFDDIGNFFKRFVGPLKDLSLIMALLSGVMIFFTTYHRKQIVATGKQAITTAAQVAPAVV